MRILSVALPMFMLAHACLAQAEETEKAYNGIPDEVIQNVGNKDIKGMFRAMAKSIKAKENAEDSISMLDSFIKQLEDELKDTGDFMDANLYKEEHFGPRFSVLTYVLNYGNKPVGLTIQMYNGKNGWRAMNVNFKTDTDKLLNELRAAPSGHKS